MKHSRTSSTPASPGALRAISTARSRETTSAIHTALLNACDARDGITDGVVENPLSCRFDPKVLQCKAGNYASCLTAPQIEMARKITSPAKYSNGREFWPGLEPGSELGWAAEADAGCFTLREPVPWMPVPTPAI